MRSARTLNREKEMSASLVKNPAAWVSDRNLFLIDIVSSWFILRTKDGVIPFAILKNILPEDTTILSVCKLPTAADLVGLAGICSTKLE